MCGFMNHRIAALPDQFGDIGVSVVFVFSFAACRSIFFLRIRVSHCAIVHEAKRVAVNIKESFINFSTRIYPAAEAK